MHQNENIQELQQIRDFAHISCKCHPEKYQTIHQTNSNTKSKLEGNTSSGVLPTKKACSLIVAGLASKTSFFGA